jgi:hypothetical protein
MTYSTRTVIDNIDGCRYEHQQSHKNGDLKGSYPASIVECKQC